MDDRQFDDQLRQKLSSLETPYDPSSWDALLRKMDAGREVDQAVAGPLAGLDAAYDRHSWEVLERKMHARKQRKTVLWFKLLEAAVFVLLLGQAYFWYQRQSSRPDPVTGPVAVRPNSSRPPYGIATPAAGAAASAMPAVSQPRSATPGQNARPIRPLTAKTYLVHTETKKETPAFLALLPTLPTTLLPDLATALQSRSQIVRPAPRQRDLYVFTLGSLERHTLRDGDHVQHNNGYALGLGLGVKNEKWGLETGAMYANKTFSPRRRVAIYGGNVNQGYYGYARTAVEADVLAIPLQITRKLVALGNTEFKALAGIQANLALQKNYRYESVYFPGSGPSSQGQPDAQPIRLQRAKGLAEGGQLSDNAYVSLCTGLRAEKVINSHMNAFTQAVYQHPLGKAGIAPNTPGISTLALSMGIITRL